MDINKLVPAEAIAAVTAMETVEQLRDAAISLDIKFSGNTGAETLRAKIIGSLEAPTPNSFLGEDDEDDSFIQRAPEPKKPKQLSIPELLAMDPNQIEDTVLLRKVVRAQSLRLIRVKVTNLDPSDAQLPGMLLTVINKYTGKKSRFISFGDENDAGQHVEVMLLNHLKNQKFALRKEKKGGQFGVKKYTTKMINKFSIEELDPLSKAEINDLANVQRASNAIDK